MTGEPIAVDVLIVGAGLSGIAVARYLKTEHPAKSFLILEARASSGGTWDLFRYPGVRSDSDLCPFGYEFRPWPGDEAIASGPRILDYLRRTATENGLDDRIRYRHHVISADWSSSAARWTVVVEDGDAGERRTLSARWLFCATGYYRYDAGYTPDFEGRERFRGPIVHPQQWPEDLDYRDKRIVVIGSGATAITLVPALARQARHVTMLQRTPSYVLAAPSRDRTALRLRRWFGERAGSALVRRRSIARQQLGWLFCRRFPTAARAVIQRLNRQQLPDGFPVAEHFAPPYDPWDQRMCLAPDGDLFAAIRSSAVSVATDRIVCFTESGVLLASGRELEADIIVTATGLSLQAVGGIALRVDGREVSPASTVVYRGLLLSGVPNLAVAVGYPNASWTLKITLVAQYFCRLLAYLDSHGFDTAIAVPDPGMPSRPLIPLTAGYVVRGAAELPGQGDAGPWRASTSYYRDVRLLRRSPVADAYLHLTGPADRSSGASSAGAAAAAQPSGRS